MQFNDVRVRHQTVGCKRGVVVMDASKGKYGHCVLWFGEPAERERTELAAAGWNVRIAAADKRGTIDVRSNDAVVVLVDLRRSQPPHLSTLDKLRAEHPQLPWLTVLARDAARHEPQFGHLLQMSAAVFTAPLDTPSLIAALVRIDAPHSREDGQPDLDFVGASPAIRAVQADIRKYAPSNLPVLITGETGTGKEVAARALHRLSARSERLFEAINCGALAPNLVQSELFGHERGAFTGANTRRIGHFELAAGGTVFLDEVADLPHDAQTSLLRLLQEGTLVRVGASQPVQLDVRVLAATHVDLEKAVAQGRFREDLYYRLNVLRLRMPALREHGDDVEALAQHFLDAFRQHDSTCAHAFSEAALAVLRAHAWPGNVRELRNRVQRAAVVAEGTHVSAADLDLHAASPVAAIRTTLNLVRLAAERDTLMACLRDSSYNVSECARRLNVSRMTVYRLCKKHLLAMKELQ